MNARKTARLPRDSRTTESSVFNQSMSFSFFPLPVGAMSRSRLTGFQPSASARNATSWINHNANHSHWQATSFKGHMSIASARNWHASIVALMVVVLGTPAHCQQKDTPPPEIRLSTALGAAYPLGRAGERWAQLINDNAAGAFEVRTHPGATLAQRDPAGEFGALRDGRAHLAVGASQGIAYTANA